MGIHGASFVGNPTMRSARTAILQEKQDVRQPSRRRSTLDAKRMDGGRSLRLSRPLGFRRRDRIGPMKLSARNVLSGKVIAITKGATTAHVKIEVGSGAVVTASITNEAVDALTLEVGKPVYAVIKASDVMVGVDQG